MQEPDLENKLASLAQRSAPRTLALLDVGTLHTAQLFTTLGQNIGRPHGATAFADLCGSDAMPASLDKTIPHLLNSFGERRCHVQISMTSY